MNEKTLRNALRDLPMGGIRFYKTTGSTNDDALAWATEGVPDLSLVAADGQTQGRGRGGNAWFTPPGSALAFSLVLRPRGEETAYIPLFSALGALAVARALEDIGMNPQIKWPNDVLLNRRKVCGILAEAVWLGESVESIVLGIGINVSRDSVPPPEALGFPATSLESETNRNMERMPLLRNILSALIEWRPRLGTVVFLKAWEERLAFRGEAVWLRAEGMPMVSGVVSGLERDGGLRLTGEDGKSFVVQFGEVQLRPVL
jgi:BirA family biotin operon repressor/biotin-[acetyl-CoA-carboxylase] ligase